MGTEHQIRSYAAPASWVERAECARVGADMGLSNAYMRSLMDTPGVHARKAVCAVCPAYGHVAGGLHPLERAQARREARTS